MKNKGSLLTPKREASRRFTLVKEGDDMKIGIIGSGRVGFSMGKYLCDHGECVVGYYDRHPERANEAAQFTSTDNFETIEDLVAASDTLFITTTAVSYTHLDVYKRQGQGILVTNEIHPARARILSENIERMGVRNAIVTNASPKQLRKHFGMFFHRIMVDAPCSGEGMFRKQETASDEWSLDNVRICADRQDEILQEAYEMLLPGGRMVYSVSYTHLAASVIYAGMKLVGICEKISVGSMVAVIGVLFVATMMSEISPLPTKFIAATRCV